MFSGTQSYSAVLKLMELMLVEARDEAVLISPAKKDEQLAALNTAHAMSKILLGFKERIQFLVDEQLADIRQIASQEAMQDRERCEEIILSQSSLG